MTTRIVKPGISILFMLFSGLFSLNNSLQAITVVKDLRVEYMKNPIGIDVTNPHFSWAMESDEIAKRQIAYEITV